MDVGGRARCLRLGGEFVVAEPTSRNRTVSPWTGLVMMSPALGVRLWVLLIPFCSQMADRTFIRYYCSYVK
jgi:hypothetical protein